jgi:hypothetical protein
LIVFHRVRAGFHGRRGETAVGRCVGPVLGIIVVPETYTGQLHYDLLSIPVIPVNHPVHARVCAGSFAGDSSTSVGSNITLNTKAGEEGCVDVGAGGSASTEVHRVGTVEARTE